jgi:RNA polymerase sigma-70 factor, ECF subfamily
MGNEIPGEDFIRDLVSHQNSLYTYILTLVPDTERARDLLQSTSVELWSKAGEYNKDTNFLAWSCRVAYYKVLAYRRDVSREPLIFGGELLEKLAEIAEGRASKRNPMADALDDCLAVLSPTKRGLIFDRYAAGKPVKTIASERGRSAQGLAVTLHRIRQLLLDCVEKKLATKGS